MKYFSILNDVLGPVMHGPSSSHTAASYRISVLARDLFGRKPDVVRFRFDPTGSYGKVYQAQGSDLAFAAGLLGWDITDGRFGRALEAAAEEGIHISFLVDPIDDDHPNGVEIELSDAHGSLLVGARSVGGGSIRIIGLNGRKVDFTGTAYEVVVETNSENAPAVMAVMDRLDGEVNRLEPSLSAASWLHKSLLTAPRPEDLSDLKAAAGAHRVWTADPILYPVRGTALFDSAAQLIELAQTNHWSMGEAAVFYETALLGRDRASLLEEMARRYDVMRHSVREGLEHHDRLNPMRVLNPTAHQVFLAEKEKRLAVGGLHTRAAARALAVMHVNAGSGLVCAAPTAGSSGTLPGLLVSLEDDLGMDRETVLRALWAASAVGLIIVTRGRTFAAEVAGCQVEIGAAGAMAAAAVVEAVGGSAAQAADAAAIALHHTMGSPCDLVQGAVEVPCHTRNAVAAASSFVFADLILGGYRNPIGLDDTVDASLEVGKRLPPELRCTSLGGLAITPSARKLGPKK